MEPVSEPRSSARAKTKIELEKIVVRVGPAGRIGTVKRIYRHRPWAAEGESMSFITFFR